MADRFQEYLTEKKLKNDMEEFEEFEEAVDRVGELIRGMAAGKIKPEDVDKELGGSLVENSGQTKRKGNVLNDRKADWDMQGTTMSQEVFMRVVEEDAKKRAKERKERNTKSDELKDKGNAAFRSGDFTNALTCFNQALGLRRDSSILYVNRGLTFLKLNRYEEACKDCDSAIKLKDTLKARLLKSRALYEKGDDETFKDYLDEIYKQFSDQTDAISDYVSEWCTVATVCGHREDNLGSGSVE